MEPDVSEMFTQGLLYIFYTVFLSRTDHFCRLPWFSQPLKGKNDKVDPSQTMKAYNGSRSMAPLIHNFSTR
jgi:hypothetical protein